MTSPSCQDIQQAASRFAAQKKWYRSLSQRAAVGILLADRPDLGPSLLMIERAHAQGDPWSGHMAFPGGKHDSDDAHITETVLREWEEELGIDSRLLQRVGRLSDLLARPYRLQQKPMVVSPLLLAQHDELHFSPNEEVADILWVPLAHFQPENRQTMLWQRYGRQHELPCYFYQEKRIWGLSLLMIDELLQVANARA
ncbi:MAG TPA: CoA pyrophosphatase [Pseudomonadales bacterium]